MNRPFNACLLALICLSGSAFAENPEDEVIEIKALALPGLKEMSRIRKEQAQEREDRERIAAIEAEIPTLTEAQGLSLARKLGSQLNQVLRDLKDHAQRDPYRGPPNELSGALIQSAEELVAFATLARGKIQVNSNKSAAAGMGTGLVVVTLFAARAAGGGFDAIGEALLYGGLFLVFPSGWIAGGITNEWQNRKFKKAFVRAFEEQLDPEFRSRFALEPYRETAYENMLEIRRCARLLADQSD